MMLTTILIVIVSLCVFITQCQQPGPDTDMFDFSRIDEPYSDDVDYDASTSVNMLFIFSH